MHSKGQTALLLLIAILLLTSCTTQRRPLADQPPLPGEQADSLLAGYDLSRVLQRVKVLTSPKLQGRAAGSAAEDKAGDYLIEELQRIGIAPWQSEGMDGYRQRFSVRGRRQTAENILAYLPGQNGDSLLVVSAHYDHLGIRNGSYYPGADDNAVGVAVLLEIAECLAQSGIKPERTVLFALLTAEENGLLGSTALANKLRRDGQADKAVVLNLDMLGGIGGNSLDIWVERSRPDGQLIASVARQEVEATGLTSTRLQRRFAVVDSLPFAKRGMPSVTLSWDLTRANHPYRHTPNDTYANLRSDLVERGSRACLRVSLALANLR